MFTSLKIETPQSLKLIQYAEMPTVADRRDVLNGMSHTNIGLWFQFPLKTLVSVAHHLEVS